MIHMGAYKFNPRESLCGLTLPDSHARPHYWSTEIDDVTCEACRVIWLSRNYSESELLKAIERMSSKP